MVLELLGCVTLRKRTHMLMRKIKLTFFLAAALALLIVSPTIVVQSLTTGAISGTITDATGAVVPGATVSLLSLDTGTTQTTSTNQAGEYRFTLLKPGRYQVSTAPTGFQKAERAVTVPVGQNVTADLALVIGAATQTIEVKEEAPLISTEPSMNTPFTSEQVALLPSAGSDITNIAFTAPGAVVNVTGGYGNFTVNGLPATSNLFTINGENDMDPYFNINNSGASNLTLGQNEIQEAMVVTNPYAGNYGQLSGAQVTYITKSGTNEFHGNAQYWWNGRYLNANNWFNNSGIYGVTPRPFSNANQWADSIGGPIWKNKTFFFFDNEGLRFVLPNVDSVTIPTQAFANAVLSNVQAKQPAEFPLYQKMVNLWLGAPGASGAVPIANSSQCRTLNLPGFNGATQNCAARFQATPTAFASEWILAFRIDQKLGNNDNAYFRYKQDHGIQPTTLDPISPNFDALSHQPSWDTQFNETHVFGPPATNSVMATLSYYFALFEQDQQLAASTFPVRIVTSSPVPFTGFNAITSFPQGRNITQYQFIDDYTLTHGSHNFKVGVNFRRYDISDHNFFFNSPGVYFGYTSNGLQQFVNGLGYQYRKTLNLASDVPIALWGMGLYAQDEWHATPNLKLTLALRIEHNSNPVCQFNCFANFKGPWSTLPSVTSATPSTVPYSSDIIYNQHQAYPSTDMINWSPRIGFSWSPGARKTVLSGGFGIFYDNLASGLVDDLLTNPPVAVQLRVRPTSGVLPFDPGPNGGASIWAQSAAAFNINQTYGQISSNLAKLGSVFAAPAFTAIVGKMHSPQFQEWNLQVQHELTNSMVFTANYVGNHGIHIPYSNAWPNAYDQYSIYPNVPGIPAKPRVPNYGTVTTVQSGALSNYNGLTLTLAKRFSHSIAGHINYTWSHAIDEVSNGGIFTYGDSTLGQINPLSLRANNYGNADYDIRHLISADFVYTPSYKLGNHVLNAALGGWQLSSKIFWRTGLPFSVFDGNTALGNGGGALLATPIGRPSQTTCGGSAALVPCLNAAQFVDASADTFDSFNAWSPQNRNMFRGAHYFGLDAALFKTVKLRERMDFAVGIQAFNLFNHPNFGTPDNTVGDSTFGQVTGMISNPTSPYGNFLGFDSSPRVVQLTGKITF